MPSILDTRSLPGSWSGRGGEPEGRASLFFGIAFVSVLGPCSQDSSYSDRDRNSFVSPTAQLPLMCCQLMAFAPAISLVQFHSVLRTLLPISFLCFFRHTPAQ
ncbi:caspase-9 [Platysternon megacephalum]|uniref:Caspase-9 n=1 Tax=Platysternon megacephalum TaxID=55544 RepID=A0A4D9F3X4_9SAUR|nr:caspase-9 [Platysternon megacephalum]